MANDTSHYVARAPRYEVQDGQRLQLTVRNLAEDAAEAREVKLVDLSRQGLQVQAAVLVSEGDRLVVELHDPTGATLIQQQATVRWQKPAEPLGWLIGCQFTDELSWEVLGELFLHELIAAPEGKVDKA